MRLLRGLLRRVGRRRQEVEGLCYCPVYGAMIQARPRDNYVGNFVYDNRDVKMRFKA